MSNFSFSHSVYKGLVLQARKSQGLFGKRLTNPSCFSTGEDIERDSENCYGMYCDYGSIVAWDAACFFSTSPCSGVNVDVPGQCCPDCIETTTPAKTTTPIPTPTLPKGCLVNGTFYEIGRLFFFTLYHTIPTFNDPGKEAF